jgi:hypothetical protein
MGVVCYRVHADNWLAMHGVGRQRFTRPKQPLSLHPSATHRRHQRGARLDADAHRHVAHALQRQAGQQRVSEKGGRQDLDAFEGRVRACVAVAARAYSAQPTAGIIAKHGEGANSSPAAAPSSLTQPTPLPGSASDPSNFPWTYSISELTKYEAPSSTNDDHSSLKQPARTNSPPNERQRARATHGGLGGRGLAALLLLLAAVAAACWGPVTAAAAAAEPACSRRHSLKKRSEATSAAWLAGMQSASCRSAPDRPAATIGYTHVTKRRCKKLSLRMLRAGRRASCDMVWRDGRGVKERGTRRQKTTATDPHGWRRRGAAPSSPCPTITSAPGPSIEPPCLTAKPGPSRGPRSPLVPLTTVPARLWLCWLWVDS